jgi:transcriptional regulator with XRE-family HTH domain
MEKYENITALIAENLIYYRKKAKLTQSEVATKLSYSDKSVSKWERAEGVPDIHVLVELAKLYGLTVNDFLTKKKKERIANRFFSKVLITSLAVGLVWFIATIAFFVLRFFLPDTEQVFKSWLIFIYAIPVSMIVLLIFNKLWGKRIFAFFIVSALIWTVGLSLERSFTHFIDWAYLFYILCIPLEVLTIFWFMLKKKTKGYSSDLK